MTDEKDSRDFQDIPETMAQTDIVTETAEPAAEEFARSDGNMDAPAPPGKFSNMPVWLKKTLYFVFALLTFEVHIIVLNWICSLFGNFMMSMIEDGQLELESGLRIYQVIEIGMFVLFTVLYYIFMRIFFIRKNWEMKDPKLPRRMKLRENGLGWKALLIGVGVSGVSFLWLQLVGKVIVNFPSDGFLGGLIQTIQEEYRMVYGSSGAVPGVYEVPFIEILLVLFTPTLIMPIAEEFLFRGLTLNAFEKVYSKWLPVLGSALIFALGHWSPIASVYAFFMGLVFALLYKKTRNIFAVCLAHIANNMVATIQDLILMFTGKESINDIINWVCAGFAVVMVVLMGALLRRRPAEKEMIKTDLTD